MVGCGDTPKLLGTAAAVFDPRVEAAVLARYGVDPWTCSLRRLFVLLQAMPPGYWPDTEVEAVWSVESHLLAGLIDAVNQTTWMVAAANSKRPPARPKPFPRPGGKAKAKGLSLGELADVLSGGATRG